MSFNNTKTLSPREQAVYDLHRAGKRPKEIALQLGISASTVNNYLDNILFKLGVNSREELRQAGSEAGA